MKRLLAVEDIGGRSEKWWLHTGDHGQDCITVETVQDVEPIIDAVSRRRLDSGGDFRFVASIPATVFEEVCKIEARRWGVRLHAATREIMQNRTDRAKAVWLMLTRGRDYRKLQV